MNDFRKLTVKYLRELARRHLGGGYSKLRKAELLEAVKKWLPKPLAKAVEVKRTTVRGKVAAKSAVRPSQGKTRVRAQRVATVPTPSPRGPEAASFVRERFFELPAEATPQKPIIEDPPVRWRRAELRGDLLVALVRDPFSVYIFCAVEAATLASAGQGLADARVVLRLYDGDQVARQHDLRLNGGALYLNGLSPGKQYVVEAVIVGQSGESRPLGLTTRVALPTRESSPSRAVRMLNLPWLTPLKGLEAAVEGGRASVRSLEGGHRQVPRSSGALPSTLGSSPSGRGMAGRSSETVTAFPRRTQ